MENSEVIDKYISFKAYTEECDFAEAARSSMARLYTQISEPKRPILIITAYRAGRKLAENQNLNWSLINDIRAYGWGFTPVIGGLVETEVGEDGTKKKTEVREVSLFCSMSGREGEYKKRVIGLLKKYSQESALIRTAEENAYILKYTGEKEPLGEWKNDPEQLAQFYTRMRHGPRGRQFKFEAAAHLSNSTRLSMSLHEKAIAEGRKSYIADKYRRQGSQS